MQYYRDLLTQRSRIEAFRTALTNTVRPTDRVLEVGTGLGTFSFFAAAAGAPRIWALDGNPIVHVARAVAQANGYDGRVEFIRGWIPEVQLPEPADLLIFEDFPPRLVDARVWRLLRDIRKHYLAPDARVLPSRANLFLAPVSSESLWREIAPFGTPSDEEYGIDWRESRRYVSNSPLSVSVPPDALAAPPVDVGGVRLSDPIEPVMLGGEARWTVSEPMTVHGLAYWFDLELCEGVRLSNRPGAEPGSWGQLLLPVDPPLELGVGAEIRGEVRVSQLDDGAPGWLSWSITSGSAEARGSEFASMPAALADLAARSPDGVPRLTARGLLEGAVLGLTDGIRSVRQIAETLGRSHPWLSPTEAERVVIDTLRDRADFEPNESVPPGSTLSRAG